MANRRRTYDFIFARMTPEQQDATNLRLERILAWLFLRSNMNRTGPRIKNERNSVEAKGANLLKRR